MSFDLEQMKQDFADTSNKNDANSVENNQDSSNKEANPNSIDTINTDAGDNAKAPVIDEHKLETQLPEEITNKLKESGFDSLDKLIEAAKKSKIEAPKVLSEEEKKQAIENERADFLNHAIKESKLSTSYIKEVESLIEANAKEVVFPSFKSKYLEVNPSAEDEDIEYAFNNQFSVNSENAAEKAQGERLLELAKKEIVDDKAKDYNSSKENFNTAREIAEAQPKFQKLIVDTFSDIPKSMELGSGEEKTNFIPTVDNAQVYKYIEENFGKEFFYTMFNTFMEGQTDQVQKVLKSVGSLAHKALVFDSALNSHGQTMKSIGAKEAVLGSKAPFNKNQEVSSTGTAKVEGLERLTEMFGG